MELNYYQSKQKLPHELTNDFRLWKNAQPVGQPLKCHQLTLIWVNFLGFGFVLRLEGSKITKLAIPNLAEMSLMKCY